MTNNQYQVSKELTEDQVNTINTLLEKYKDSNYWTRRTDLTRRSVDGSSCEYDFMSMSYMPKDLKEYLLEVAPRENGYFIGEVCVNRYNKGDYIGKHRDRDYHRMNRVISLQAEGDGLYIEDDNVFIEDAVGQAVTITGVGPVHSVPAVKNKRHVLIVLYE